MFLDRIFIRKLENGYTIKYHVADVEHHTVGDMAGQTKERFVTDRGEVAKFVNDLILNFIKDEPK